MSNIDPVADLASHMIEAAGALGCWNEIRNLLLERFGWEEQRLDEAMHLANQRLARQ